MVCLHIFFSDSDDDDATLNVEKMRWQMFPQLCNMCTCMCRRHYQYYYLFFFKVQMESFTGHVHQATMCIVQREAVGDLDRKNSFYIPIELAVYVPTHCTACITREVLLIRNNGICCFFVS